VNRVVATLVVGLLLTALGLGCGSKGQKGENSGTDMPKPAQKP
jgi:hypothetical protein